MSEPLPASTQDVARQVLGWGLAMEEIAPGQALGFDLAWRSGPQGSDLRLVEGAENLAQDLAVALLTPLGSDLFNIRFGFNGLEALTRPLEPAAAREFLRLAVVRTVGTDPRIRQVLGVTLEPVAPGERRWRIDVEAQTVLGDVVAFVLGEVNPSG